MNGKEKLNHLIYLPRIIQGGGGTKHGYQKLRIKAAGVERAIKGLALPKGGAFIELGCGAHDPLALPTYFYLNGFEPCYGIDLLPPRTEYYSAMSMYDICLNVRTFPRSYCRPGVEPKDILARLKDFHLTKFEQGNLAAGFGAAKDKVKFLQEDICEADIKRESCSLIVSFAVLEHVTDITRVAQTLYDLLLPGGVVYHFVDLADHRSYRGDGAFGPLSFLADEVAPPNMNRLRAPQITEAHVAAGFEVLRDSRETAEMPDEILKNLQPRFKAFSLEDVSVIKQSLILRKPGTART
ncbi:MAG TPA: methyltransferase domain-containing protein [Rhodoblastus sp.]|nr:methyltransferase domain-containing protein [Rhodoblastus sp.]